MKHKKIVNDKKIIWFGALIFLLLFAGLAVSVHLNMRVCVHDYEKNSLDLIRQRLQFLSLDVDTFSATVAHDILFLSRLSCFQQNKEVSASNPHGADFEAIDEDLIAFLKQNEAYYQIRYLDVSGQEIDRAEFVEGEYRIQHSDALQNKKDTDYFQKTIRLEKGEVYVSELDLNIENGVLENRGSAEYPVYVPVVRYATPVFGLEDEMLGILVANVYADSFLEDVRRFQRAGELTFLVNSEGYYLAHPNAAKEFAFDLENRVGNIQQDYPDMAAELLGRCDGYHIEIKDAVFTHHCIFPRTANFEIYQASKRIFGESGKNKYHWILVSVSDKEEIQKTFEHFGGSHFWFLILCGIVISTIVVLLYLVFLKDIDIARRS